MEALGLWCARECERICFVIVLEKQTVGNTGSCKTLLESIQYDNKYRLKYTSFFLSYDLMKKVLEAGFIAGQGNI